MATIDEVKSCVDRAIEHSKEKADGVIVRGLLSKASQIRFSQSAIDVAKHWDSFKLQLFVIVDGKKTGVSERSISEPEQAKDAVDDAIAFTKRLPESSFFQGVEESISKYDVLDSRFDPKIDRFIEEAPDAVNSTIDSALNEGAKRVAGALAFKKEFLYFQSSYGPEGDTMATSFDINVRAFQDELDYSGQGLACGNIPSDAEQEMIEAGSQAGRLSKQAIGARQGEPGIYDLVLNPTVAANVMGDLGFSANPFIVMIGMSPLGDKMGQQLAPEFVTMIDDPKIPGGLASRPFDFEGTPTKRTSIFDRGVLKAFLHNTSTARMHNTESTGSSDLLGLGHGLKMLVPVPSNITFEKGDHSLEELLEGTKPTIYVTCNWYTRWQNYLTGEFSTIPRDAMFLIEKGEMKPIKNLRISDNILRMFKNISALGKDLRQVYWWEVEVPTFVPSMRVADCRMSAATQ